MNLLEWMKKSHNTSEKIPANYENRKINRRSRGIVLLKIVISMLAIAVYYYLWLIEYSFSDNNDIILVTIALIIYLLLGFISLPKPDYSDLGLMGGLVDDRSSYTDDYNRALLLFRIILWPGNYIAISIKDFIVMIKHINDKSKSSVTNSKKQKSKKKF